MPKTITTRLGRSSMRQKMLKLEAKTLPPDEYIFTLEVSKGDFRSETNCTVTVVSERIPTSEILAVDTKVVPYSKFVATG